MSEKSQALSAVRHAVSMPEIAALYVCHERALRVRARALLDGPEEAEDVLQEVFVALLERPDMFRREAAVFTVLYRIATHKALDRVRMKGRRCSLLDESVQGGEEAAHPVCHGGIGQIDAAMDLGGMARLESQRVLVAARLHFVEGYTQDEVARMQGVSRKTVGRGLSRLLGLALGEQASPSQRLRPDRSAEPRSACRG